MNATKKPFSRDILHIADIESLTEKICEKLRHDVFKLFRRNGGVVGISGGIDSSVSMALAARAFKPERVLGIMLPEHDSSPDSFEFAKKLADKFNVRYEVEDITEALNGFGCYQRRDEAIKRVVPEFNPDTDKSKIVIKQDILQQNMPAVFSVTVIKQDGSEISKVLPLKAYLEIVAASNFKQRSRMSMLYFHAEANHYVVVGTPNKQEVKQGFFVKYGDGGADMMPIGNLFKTQVYQLAEYLGVPKEIIERTPTTDTYTAEQTQEEFFYQLPFQEMDLLWYAWENGYDPAEVGPVMNLTEDQVKHVFATFQRKEKTTDYLRMPPLHDYYV